ncbi:MAG: exodeoxyribonuclease VII large subunit [Bryobacterales bacterium]|nr:exodeoxyribonuclease VII large subunit [Bryobacterales bacterium]
MRQSLLDLTPERRIFTVGELTEEIREALDRSLGDVWVRGEISGVKLAASGHYYFTLKDTAAQVRCVCFRGTHRFLKFKPKDGLAVQARGRIDVYAARGEYQLLVDWLDPVGHGALQLAFEQLKKQLAAEGLFDAARKRSLPRIPWRIGIVTSPRGAVIADLTGILIRRFPGLQIRLYPALVQGEGAVDEVCRGIAWFSHNPWADVVIVARGGGSIEDLWTFNEEAVARAIAACPVPVVSAIGHDTDFTIADFVADLRAPTPSAAAELVAPERRALLESVAALANRLAHHARYRIALTSQRLHRIGTEKARRVVERAIGLALQRTDDLELRARDSVRSLVIASRKRWSAVDSRLREQDMRPRLERSRARHEALSKAAAAAVRGRLAESRRRLDLAEARLAQLSPVSILDRGYAIVSTRSGAIVRDAAAAPARSEIAVRLATGRLRARVLAEK